MLSVRTPAEVSALRAAEQAEREANRIAPESNTVVDELAAHIRKCWNVAKQEKMHINARLIDCLRRRQGEYDPAKLQAIRGTGGSEIFMQITGAKCRAAKSWLSDLFNPPTGDFFECQPTPIPDLPPDIKQQLMNVAVQGGAAFGVPPDQVAMLLQQHEDRIKKELMDEARNRMSEMQQHINDVLVEADWIQVFDDFIDDLVTYPTAIVRGPIYAYRKQVSWGNNGAMVTEAPQPVVERKLTREFRRVSPFDFFPGPGCRKIGDTWAIERIRFTRTDLAAMRDAPGYRTEQVVFVLNEYANGGLREWIWDESERDALEGRSHFPYKTDTIDALEWSGHIRGQTLIDWGMDPAVIPDPHDEYLVSAILVGNYVIRAMVNPDPTGRHDYYAASWEPVPGAFWGNALPEVLADCQDACNGAARALINNMAIGSGPQVAVDLSQRADKADYTEMRPWKIWYFDAGSNPTTRQGISFFQPSINAQELLGVYERFTRYADDITGLPAYAYGSDQGAGAARTASGLNMLMNAASKTVKGVVRQIDMNVVEPVVTKLYVSLMLDPAIPATAKGDAKVRALGSAALVHKEIQQNRILQLLGVTMNPMDTQIIGLEGRRSMLDEAVKSMDLPVNPIPSAKDFQQMQAAAAAQQAAMMQAQAAAGGPPAEPGSEGAPA